MCCISVLHKNYWKLINFWKVLSGKHSAGKYNICIVAPVLGYFLRIFQNLSGKLFLRSPLDGCVLLEAYLQPYEKPNRDDFCKNS